MYIFPLHALGSISLRTEKISYYWVSYRMFPYDTVHIVTFKHHKSDKTKHPTYSACF